MSVSEDGHDRASRSAPELPGAEEEHRSLLSEVSREMIRLYKNQFGRGPTKVRSDFAGPNCLICTLEDSMTPAERNMVALDEHARLRDTRTFFQHASEDEFRGVIERLTGRKVCAFVSGIDTAQDVSSEVFYFSPCEATVDGDQMSAPS